MNWKNKAEANWTSARAKQWLVAMIISNRAIRVDSCSDDTMTQLRGAWEMYMLIRNYNSHAKARELRAKYGYSRFYDIALLFARYEFDIDICVEYIESPTSNAAMEMQLVDRFDPLPEWERKAGGWYRSFDKLAHVAYDAPEWFVSWVKDSRDLFRQNGFDK